MSMIVNCPSCEGKLRVPDDLLGRLVKCPTCGTNFTAAESAREEETPAAPSAEQEADESPWGKSVPEEVPAGGEDEESRRRLPRRRESEDDEDEDRPLRRRS